MNLFSSSPRALVAILALASISAGCSQMRGMMSGDTGATSGSSGSSGSASTGSGSGAASDRLINNSGQTQGTTPGTSLPVSDGSR